MITAVNTGSHRTLYCGFCLTFDKSLSTTIMDSNRHDDTIPVSLITTHSRVQSAATKNTLKGDLGVYQKGIPFNSASVRTKRRWTVRHTFDEAESVHLHDERKVPRKLGLQLVCLLAERSYDLHRITDIDTVGLGEVRGRGITGSTLRSTTTPHAIGVRPVRSVCSSNQVCRGLASKNENRPASSTPRWTTNPVISYQRVKKCTEHCCSHDVNQRCFARYQLFYWATADCGKLSRLSNLQRCHAWEITCSQNTDNIRL